MCEKSLSDCEINIGCCEHSEESGECQSFARSSPSGDKGSVFVLFHHKVICSWSFLVVVLCDEAWFLSLQPLICSAMLQVQQQGQMEAMSHSSVVPGAANGVPAVSDTKQSSQPVKLFVGQIPRTYFELELQPIFSEYGVIVDLKVLKDRVTDHHKGKNEASTYLTKGCRLHSLLECNNLSLWYCQERRTI